MLVVMSYGDLGHWNSFLGGAHFCTGCCHILGFFGVGVNGSRGDFGRELEA